MTRLCRLLLVAVIVGSSIGAQAVTGQSASTDNSPGPQEHNVHKYALLVGIDRYKYANPRKGFHNLRGPVNDVRNMRTLLLSFGFHAQDITTLTNSQATHQAIVAAFRRLIKRVTPGDIVVFHFSGHGSQADDPSKPSELVETLVAYDSRKPGRTHTDDITGDELNDLIGQLQNQSVTVIVDACHSGGLLGVKGLGVVRSIPADPTGAGPASSRGTVLVKPLRIQTAKYAYIAASGPNESAQEYEVDGTVQGALTHALTQVLLTHERTSETYRDVFPIIRNDVHAVFSTQTPMLDGTDKDSLIFSDISKHSQPFIEADPGSKPGVVLLQAGSSLLMTVGSVFDIYRPGSDKVDSSAKLGTAKIEEVSSYTSTARLERPTDVPVGSRAIERRHVYADFKFRVWFDGIARSSTLQAIAHAVDANNIKITARPEGSLARLADEGQRVVLYAADGRRVLASLVKSSDLVPKAVAKLAFWARWFNVRDITNLQPSLELRFDVVGSNGLLKTDSVGDVLLPSGGKFRCRFTSQSDQPLYISVLDLTDKGDVKTVYELESTPLAPGNPHTTQEFEADAPHGAATSEDVLKVFVTDVPVDFTFLNQTADGRGLRNLPPKGAHSPLTELLAQSGMGYRRDINAVPSDWMTTERIVKVEPAPAAD